MCTENINLYLSPSTEKIVNAITEGLKTPTWDGWLTFIGTVFVGIVASWIAISNSKKSSLETKRKDIVDMLDKIIMISIKYPKLEDHQFALKFHKDPKDEEYMRYDNYCCMVFNFIERLWKFCTKDSSKMKDVVYFEEYIYLHRTWWTECIRENSIFYEQEFNKFIDKEYNEYCNKLNKLSNKEGD